MMKKPAFKCVWILCCLGWAGPGVLSPIRAEPAEKASSALSIARQLNQAFVEVAERVSPSVVILQVAHREDYGASFEEEHPFWNLLPRDLQEQFEEQWKQWQKEHQELPQRRGPRFDSQGSGVVIREDGYILTNRHVVEGADKILVRFKDGSEQEAEIRGEDAQSDIAVLKVEKTGLTPAKVGNSSRIQVGEFAIAIGAPYDLDYSVTFGHVSAKGRSWLLDDATMDQDFIQTDANINPGNSGGPLVNIEGEVIGINTLIRGLRSGIGFAIPIDLAMEVADKLIANGKYVRAWLGVGIEALRNHEEYRDLVTELKDGVVITYIRDDGPAFKSDLRPNDIIVAVSGQPVANVAQLKGAIRTKTVDEVVTLDIHRLDADFKGTNLQVQVKLEPWPDELFPVLVRRALREEDPVAKLGLKVELLTSDLAQQYGVEKIQGLIVTEVKLGSIADKKGIVPGDVITEVNQKTVHTPKQLREILKEANLAKGIILNYNSRGTSKFEILKESGD